MAKYVCRNCGAENPEAAEHCVRCGAALAISSEEPSTDAEYGRGIRAGVVGEVWSRILDFFGHKKTPQAEHKSLPYPKPTPQPSTRILMKPSPSVAMPSGADPSRNAIARSIIPTGSAMPTQPSGRAPSPQGQSGLQLKPRAPGERFYDRYHIQAAYPLRYSIYYDAVDLFCARCQRDHSNLPSGGVCAYCRNPLDPVLIHERQTPVEKVTPEMVKALLPLGRAGHPRILHHRSMLRFELAYYTIVNHPGKWQALVPRQRPLTFDEAVAVVAQIGRAFTYLHQQGFAYASRAHDISPEGMEGFVVLGSGDVQLTDLSRCSALMQGEARRAQISHDIAFLGQCLISLTYDLQSQAANEMVGVPLELRPCVERAKRGEYNSVIALLNDLTVMSESPTARRLLKPTEGHATHPGRRHTHNEDTVVTFGFDKKQQGKSVPIGFYMVADGMGGHDAGDVASRTASQMVTDWIMKTRVLPDLRKTTRKLSTENVPGEVLKQAIQTANDALVQRAQARDSNLGSTITAALVIGNEAVIANVGDSRTYLLRQGQLRQITQDHSLVARLVEANVITPEEVREHPQRNQIYRSLGQKPNVQVDTFALSLQPDDRLILCCDGLWEMVADREIQRIVESARTPQKACDALITAANQAGGEDNISVIVVEME